MSSAPLSGSRTQTAQLKLGGRQQQVFVAAMAAEVVRRLEGRRAAA